MLAFISKKLSLVLLLCSWCIALSIIFLMNYALAGPKLGPVYDILMDFRSPPPVSPEILLIETDEVIEPADLFSVLMAMSEMGASDLLVEVPLMGSGSGIAETGLEFSYRINDEFDLVGKNIRNLFEAIRLGLVSPVESPSYVESVVELTEQGRDRLNAAIIRQDEEGTVLAAQAASVFGGAISALDLRSLPEEEIPWYSRPRPDRDGMLRRIAPAAEAEHIAYRALMPRWEETALVTAESGQFLVNSFENHGEEVTYRFPLDREGNILIERKAENDFRRLTLNYFRDYDQTGRILIRLLRDAEALGAYDEITPEQMPHILFDFAENLKEELLKAPSVSKHTEWVNARAAYIASLQEFITGPSEVILVKGYEELIATEELGEAGIERLQNMRNELIRSFAAMKEEYRAFIKLRTLLADSIGSSFCIMGPPVQAGVIESSALLANTLLTGHCITPGQTLYIVLLSAAAVFVMLACIYALWPPLLLILGLVASLICGAAFGVSFVISGYWIDPFIPMAACLGGTLFLTVTRFFIGYGRMLQFRFVYSGAVNGKMLKQLVKMGRPSLTETLCAHAVIIAVKNPGMTRREDRGTASETAKTSAKFRREFSSFFKRQGALVLSFEHDIALACFGSPAQRLCEKESVHPVMRAIPCIKEIMRNPVSAGWRLGLEYGECAFSWSGETGYVAHGHSVIRARIFTSLAARYKVRAIIGEVAGEASGLDLKKIASLSGEVFYELPV